MYIDLLNLLKKFDDADDVETDTAIYRTRVPSVGPEAYLNVIFKPSAAEVREGVASNLHFPPPLVTFYSEWNGARLFVNGINIYGCVPQGQLLRRTESFALSPFNIEAVNREFANSLYAQNLVCIGSYGWDRSLVCVDRRSFEVVCFRGEDLGMRRKIWRSLERWIVSELARIEVYFDASGDCLVEPDRLVPE
jgi:hypothetical protein